jgi:hypothetical protein
MTECCDWTAADAPRIWRCPRSRFMGDEPMTAASIYDVSTLREIADHGFNGVWLRGRMAEVMDSTVLPMLNHASAGERRASLNTVIERGGRLGMGVYLYMNEPLALPEDHALWKAHPELAGERFYSEFKKGWLTAICQSTPLGRQFFQQAIASVLSGLPGLAGIVLITASEHHTHCWSRIFRRPLNDGSAYPDVKAPACPRCATREPADIVLDLLTDWRDAARNHAPQCRIIAWNWSWSAWYDEPQREIVSRLPQGVVLMGDWERGGQRQWMGRTIPVDEYSLTYAGPSGRFMGSRDAAPAGSPVYARLQLGTTHEIATVPNLPLLGSVHAKLSTMSRLGIGGMMACWNFGASLTLNTYAVALYRRDPARFADAREFLPALARDYFGSIDAGAVVSAWQGFEQAFQNHPSNTPFLYWSPVNDAPAVRLSLDYRARQYGPSWLAHEPGDDPSRCMGFFSLDDIVRGLSALVRGWDDAMAGYEQALAGATGDGTDLQRRHRREELSTARMIGRQFRSALNIFRFHQRRVQLQGAQAGQPGRLPADAPLLAIMKEEVANARAAAELADQDPRLGYHQECHAALYDAAAIRAKVRDMETELAAVEAAG